MTSLIIYHKAYFLGTGEVVDVTVGVDMGAQEGTVVSAVVGAGVIEDSGQLNGAIVEPATFFANGFPERSITGE
jgi:pyruvoyl-dependent arginine decarboxylase (PvlArgDC)